jgi:hypothetical protein
MSGRQTADKIIAFGLAGYGGRMSFEEEWSQLKAAALARRSAATRLNQAADQSAPGVGAGEGLEYGRASINGNANLLVEIAGLLHEGRPDGELSMMARVPRAHGDVAAQVNRFSTFANDQFLDGVALFAALSTKLSAAGNTLVAVDGERATSFLEVVLSGDFVPPEAR